MSPAPDEPTDEQFLGEGPRAFVRRVGEGLGRDVRVGDIIALVGALGAGKTFLARAIASGAGLPRATRVASPTFNIVQRYEARLPIYHADLYRLRDSRELADLGLFETASDGVLIVEWADRFAETMPDHTLWVRLERVKPLRRRVFVRRPAHDGRGTLGS